MKLLTKEIIEMLEKTPTGSTEGTNIVPIIVKFFTPWSNWTWYAIEGEKTEDGDWLFFGFVEGHEKELGNFLLSEIEECKGPMGLKIERDRHFDGMVLNKRDCTIHYAGK